MSAWWEEKDQNNEDFTMEDCNLLAEMLAAMIKGSTYSMSPEERAKLQKMIDVWGKRCPVPEPETKPKPKPKPEPQLWEWPSWLVWLLGIILAVIVIAGVAYLIVQTGGLILLVPAAI